MPSKDSLTPFMIHELPVRGRVVRLGSVVDHILSRHNYPEVVSQALAETLVIAGMLASNLKHQGVFTIQVQAKGAVSLLVVDAVYGGALRGYAQFDEAKVAALPKQRDLSVLFGEGHLAITLDTGEGSQRYQGIVPLEGDSISDAVGRYFTQSQQMDIHLKLSVGSISGAGHPDEQWVAGGIYIEKMPDTPLHDEDAWQRIKTLMMTVRDDELLDETLSASDLLHRLFHEDGVWVYDAMPLMDQCRCSREKIGKTLAGMGASAIEEMMVDGQIEVICQFCNRAEVFVESDIKQQSSN